MPITLLLPADLQVPYEVSVAGSDGSIYRTECPAPSGCGNAVSVPISTDTIVVTVTGIGYADTRTFAPSYEPVDVDNCSDCVTAVVDFGPVE